MLTDFGIADDLEDGSDCGGESFDGKNIDCGLLFEKLGDRLGDIVGEPPVGVPGESGGMGE